MRTFNSFLIAIFAVVTCAGFSSCSDDDDDKSPDGGGSKNARQLISVMIDSDATYTLRLYDFNYDSQNRVTSYAFDNGGIWDWRGEGKATFQLRIFKNPN